jgi:hypothetical protein
MSLFLDGSTLKFMIASIILHKIDPWFRKAMKNVVAEFNVGTHDKGPRLVHLSVFKVSRFLFLSPWWSYERFFW